MRNVVRTWKPSPSKFREEMSFNVVYAIVKAGGRQEKVSVGDVVVVDKLAEEIGASIELQPLMLVDGDAITVEPRQRSLTLLRARRSPLLSTRTRPVTVSVRVIARSSRLSRSLRSPEPFDIESRRRDGT